MDLEDLYKFFSRHAGGDRMVLYQSGYYFMILLWNDEYRRVANEILGGTKTDDYLLSWSIGFSYFRFGRPMYRLENSLKELTENGIKCATYLHNPRSTNRHLCFYP